LLKSVAEDDSATFSDDEVAGFCDSLLTKALDELATVFAELLDTTDFPEEELADFAEETTPIDEEDSSLTVTGVPSDESPHAQNTSKPTQKRKSNLRKFIIIQPSINIHQNKHPLLSTTKKNYNSTKRE
jgi:hypothetical protein